MRGGQGTASKKGGGCKKDKNGKSWEGPRKNASKKRQPAGGENRKSNSCCPADKVKTGGEAVTLAESFRVQAGRHPSGATVQRHHDRGEKKPTTFGTKFLQPDKILAPKLLRKGPCPTG